MKRGCDNCGRLNHLEEACTEPKQERRNPSRECVVCGGTTYTQQNRYCSFDCAETDGECSQ